MNNYQLKTPVIFLTFNRPDTTKKVFEVIRQVKPPILLVSADGARKDKPGELEKCTYVRQIIDTVDWKCEVIKNYSEENLGSYKKNSSSLSWAFNFVEEAIILEDDCLPNISFFEFCEELLNRYRHNKQVSIISGNNFQFGNQRTKYSYYFSQYVHVWGWATWRRCWQNVDLNMNQWHDFYHSGGLAKKLQNIREFNYWKNIFNNMYKGKRKYSWDYQLFLSSLMQNQLTILPNVNLVSNLGFEAKATNTKYHKSPLANIPTEKLEFPLQHPPYIIRNQEADNFTYKNMLSFSARAKNKLKSFFRI